MYATFFILSSARKLIATASWQLMNDVADGKFIAYRVQKRPNIHICSVEARKDVSSHELIQ